MKKYKLQSNWFMKECGTSKRYEATVPCSVLSCLMEAEEIPDPYVGLNEYEVRDLSWKDYEFETTFSVLEEDVKQERVELIFHGLDTLTEIFLNETTIGCTSDMHRTYRFSVKEALREGENTLRILFRSPLRFIEEYQYQEGKEITFVNSGSIPGNQLIRKSHSMLGWDWGAQLPDAGIFREVELRTYSHPTLEQVLFEQNHEENQVVLTTSLKFDNLSAGSLEEYKVLLQLIDPNGDVLATEEKPIKEKVELVSFSITNPQLWWPNGLGEQPLYQVICQLCDGKQIRDEKEYTIGLRTLTISQEKDEWGEEFAFCVNGSKIFTKGANYIPEDCIYPHIDFDRLDRLTEDAVRANYNCLRVWGGGYYPSDAFYQLCDQKGLIVWQDFMFACNAYDVTEEFAENVVQEVIDNVCRIQHHACLGLWCGNNEIESAWENWDGFKKEKPALKADYIKLFEHILPKALKSVDTNTFFWPSSPSSGGNFDHPDDENRGDTHYWAVWHGLLPFSDYRKHFFRFCSEFGFQSFPSMKTVRYYAKEGERNIFSKVMESHQKNDAANGKMLYYLSETFCYPKDFENLLYVTQILQAQAIKYGVEHFRRNRGRCMGSLYWQMNDNWPVASWASVDYFGRWKALHYFAKRFYDHVTGSLMIEGDKAEAWIGNETLDGVLVKVSLSLKTVELEEIERIETQVLVPALSAVKVLEATYAHEMSVYLREAIFCEMTVVYPDGKKQVEADIFVPYKHLKLPKVQIKKEIIERETEYEIILSSQKFAAFVELDFDGLDAIFEDNYFWITSKENIVITLAKCDLRAMIGEAKTEDDFRQINVDQLKSMLRIRSLGDTYEA